MLATRVIPCLLLDRGRLVKTIRFADPKYVGDPINAVRIFNDKEVDELLVLDIGATPQRRGIDFSLLGELASECFMPLAYGGGIASVTDMERLFRLGIEKVVLNSAAIELPELVREAATAFGSQSVVVAIDIKRDWLGRTRVRYCSGKKIAKVTLEQHLAAMQEAGAGELVINSIDRDGTRSGYDIDSLRLAASSVTVPVIALGGAGSLDHMREAADQAGISALAAGSLFVFHGPNRAVLIQYPGYAALGEVFSGRRVP